MSCLIVQSAKHYQLPYTLKLAPSSTGMHEIPSAQDAANQHYPSTQARNESALQQTLPPYPQLKEELHQLKQSPASEQLVQQEKAYQTFPSLEQILQLLWL